jgi:hypothetical protein
MNSNLLMLELLNRGRSRETRRTQGIFISLGNGLILQCLAVAVRFLAPLIFVKEDIRASSYFMVLLLTHTAKAQDPRLSQELHRAFWQFPQRCAPMLRPSLSRCPVVREREIEDIEKPIEIDGLVPRTNKVEVSGPHRPVGYGKLSLESSATPLTPKLTLGERWRRM